MFVALTFVPLFHSSSDDLTAFVFIRERCLGDSFSLVVLVLAFGESSSDRIALILMPPDKRRGEPPLVAILAFLCFDSLDDACGDLLDFTSLSRRCREDLSLLSILALLLGACSGDRTDLILIPRRCLEELSSRLVLVLGASSCATDLTDLTLIPRKCLEELSSRLVLFLGASSEDLAGFVFAPR
jgi:hypothetical protein